MPDPPPSAPRALIGFHASHEQFTPSELLACVRAAESAGFDAAMCSDHFAPWSERQGHSGAAWPWLGAALEATKLSLGVVSAPGQRQHPALIAQAAATLAEMYPGRFWMALASGEALNEHITGDRWLPKPARRERLRECVDVIRALFAGETVSHDGLVRVDRAKLYTRPDVAPMLVGPAVSEDGAKWVAGWADALVTVLQPRAQLERVVAAFRGAGGEHKPMFLQVHLAWDRDENAALAAAHDQWRNAPLGGDLLWDLEMPAQFDAASAYVKPDDLRPFVRISSDLGQHRAWLEEDLALGFDRLYLHEVGRTQRAFIEAFGTHVLPALRSR